MPRYAGHTQVLTTRVQHHIRLQKAIALICSGVTNWDVIASQCGWNRATSAHNAVTAWLKRQAAMDAETLRTLENARLDELQQRVWARAMNQTTLVDAATQEAVLVGTDLPAVEMALKVHDRRAKLNGLHKDVVDVNLAGKISLTVLRELADKARTSAARDDLDVE